MLNEYKRKRNFKLTSEPGPGKAKANNELADLTFVIQKHSATRLHYDFRLEIDGVLVSWAVPKGPSLDPADKRLAVRTEDHPLDYASFEGTIPKGSYGAGPVIVWDNGTYTPDDNDELNWNDRAAAEKRMRAGLKSGKLSFTLRGKKLQGSWALVRLKNTKNDWLLIKHHDRFAQTNKNILLEERSVMSDRTIEDIETGRKTVDKTDLSLLAGARKSVMPTAVTPMLATLADQAFDNSQWIFEPKLDGIRAISFINQRKLSMVSRQGLDLTKRFAALAKELAHNHTQSGLILDGEVVALDEHGKSSFQLLQQSAGLRHLSKGVSSQTPAAIVYYVFDILYLNGFDLRGVSLLQRKKILKSSLVTSEHVRLIDYFPQKGKATYAACIKNGFEGTMAKKIDGIYESGRSRDWLKFKNTNTAEFIIAGYKKGQGSRAKSFGALLLGYYDPDGRLLYAGNVGTGFDRRLLDDLMSTFESLTSKTMPFSQKPPGQNDVTWLKPKLVAEIKFAEWTQDKRLRAPVFMHVREDIAPLDVGKAKVVHVGQNKKTVKHAHSPARAPIQAVDKKENASVFGIIEQLKDAGDELNADIDGYSISFTHLNKVYWPAEQGHDAITKRDLLIYYAQVAPFLIPHMKDRPVTLLRFPNGYNNGKFYQKHFEHHPPAFVETCRLYSEQNHTDQEYILCNNLPTLLWLGQIADLELHTWAARVNPEPDARKISTKCTGGLDQIKRSILNYPDYIFFDLDPYIYSGKEVKGAEPELNRAAFEKTCEVALIVKEMLDPLNMEAYLKTTGKTGLHIYLPIIRKYDYDTVRSVAETIGRAIVQKYPKLVTMEWSVAKRTDKIFFDHNMNSRGKTLRSIYSAAAAPGAPVSIPISWQEIGKIYPSDYTIKTTPQRLAQYGDLWVDILKNKVDLKSSFKTAAAK